MRFTGDSLLLSLNELFLSMYFSKESKKKTGKAGRLDNKKFINKLQSVNAIFDNCIQHDAHELLVTLLSSVSETLEHEELIRLIFELRTMRELVRFLEEASSGGMDGLQDSAMSLSVRSEDGKLNPQNPTPKDKKIQKTKKPANRLPKKIHRPKLKIKEKSSTQQHSSTLYNA